MESEWQTLSLREAGVSLIDCDHRTPPAAESGYPYIAIPQLKQGRLDLTDARRITREHFLEWTRKANPRPYDVILSRRCNPGETAFVPPGLEGALGQNLVLLRADGTKVFPPFLRWLVRSPAWWEQVETFINVGAVFDSLRCADIPKFRLPIPPFHQQEAIAAVLGDFDEKIELNRKINATLEQVAQALFKSWFVDFDPVKAKVTGRQPEGMDAETAALFPSEFEESELGQIPKGWEVRKFEEFIKRLPVGKKYEQKTALKEGSVPILDQGKSGIIGYHNDQPGVYASIDVPVVVFANHTCYMRLITYPFSAIQNVLPFVGNRVHTLWAFWATKDKQPFIEYKGHWPDFASKQAVVPEEPLTNSFAELFRPFIALMRSTEVENDRLMMIRDSLLPKLISGQIRISQIEQGEGGAQ